MRSARYHNRSGDPRLGGYYPARYNQAEYNQGATQRGELRLRLGNTVDQPGGPEFARTN